MYRWTASIKIKVSIPSTTKTILVFELDLIKNYSIAHSNQIKKSIFSYIVNVPTIKYTNDLLKLFNSKVICKI